MPELPVIGDAMSKKIGPVPVPLAIVGGGLAVWFLLSRKGTAPAGDSTMPLPVGNAGDNVSTDGGFSYGSGGGTPVDPIFYGPPDVAPAATTKGSGTMAAPAPTAKTVNGVPQSIRNDPVPGPTATIIGAAKQLANFVRTPVTTIGNYLSVSGAKPTFTGGGASSATIPGTTLTQGVTSADIISESQARIAASPELQRQIAQANVTEEQRKRAVLGENGTLIFLN